MQSLGCGDRPKVKRVLGDEDIKNNSFIKILLALVAIGFFAHSAYAREVVRFPRTYRAVCQKYLGEQQPSSVPAKRWRNAEIVDLDTRRSVYVGRDQFFKNYSIPHSLVYAYSPKGVADFHPRFTSTNFNSWRRLNEDFILDSQQESIVLMGFQTRNGSLFVDGNNNSRPAANYKAIMQEHFPAEHTTYSIPPFMRMLIATLEFTTATNSYMQNENLALKTKMNIDYRLVISNKKAEYAARDFISSWFTQGSYERNIQDFLIRFIDQNVINKDSFRYEKEFKEQVLTMLRSMFKSSNEVLSSLETLEREYNLILRLSLP